MKVTIMKARADRASRPTTTAMMSLPVTTAPDEAEVFVRWPVSCAWRTPARAGVAADAADATRPSRASDVDAVSPIKVAFRRCCMLHRLPTTNVRKCGGHKPAFPHALENDFARDLLRPVSRT